MPTLQMRYPPHRPATSVPITGCVDLALLGKRTPGAIYMIHLIGQDTNMGVK